jgi:hypothetical protein
MSLPSPGQKSEPSKNSAEVDCKLSLLGLLFGPDDGSLNYTALQLRRL